MNNLLEYGGYHARIELDSEEMIFVGTVFGINDSLSFHGTSIEELREHFKECIDDYLLLCSQIGKEPEKEFRGSFNIRIDPELHKEIAYSAFKNNRSMNKEIEIAVSEYLHPKAFDKQNGLMTPWLLEINKHYYGSAQNSTKQPLHQGYYWPATLAFGG